MKLNWLLFFSTLSFFSCISNDNTDDSVKDATAKKILLEEGLSFAKNRQGKLIVLKNKFCEGKRCENYFSNFSDRIFFYTKEDIFMKGIKNYIEFIEINKEKNFIKVKKVKGKQVSIMTISL